MSHAQDLASRWKQSLQEAEERARAESVSTAAALAAAEARIAEQRTAFRDLLDELAGFGSALGMAVQRAEDQVVIADKLTFHLGADGLAIAVTYPSLRDPTATVERGTISRKDDLWVYLEEDRGIPLFDEGMLYLGVAALGLPPLPHDEVVPEAPVEVAPPRAAAPMPQAAKPARQSAAPAPEYHPAPPRVVEGTTRPAGDVESPTTSRKTAKILGSSIKERKDLW